MNYLLEIAFNGSAYHGFQRQKTSISVQEEVENALAKLLQEHIVVTGCGRTDTGVHATSFFLNFKTNFDTLPEKFHFKLNEVLSTHISCQKIWQVPDGFNARFAAKERTYEYRVHFIKNPFLQEQSLMLRRKPNITLMNKAATLLIGEKDFQCFSKVHTEVANFICTLTQAQWVQQGDTALFTITANRFLRNMVRAVVGTLLEIGYEKHPPAYMLEVLKSGDRSKAGKSVAAKGLYLVEIKYDRKDWVEV